MFNAIERYNSPNFTAGAESGHVFGYNRDIRYIVIHHWGAPGTGLTFAGTISWLINPASVVSAHAVVEAGKAAFLVNPWDVAWAAGNAQGNAQGLQIECRPEMSAEDLETVCEVVAHYRELYGDLIITRHDYWFNTECPGKYDIDYIDRRAYEIGQKWFGRPFGG